MTATKVKGRKPTKPPAGPPELPPHLFELRDEELLAALEVESDGVVVRCIAERRNDGPAHFRCAGASETFESGAKVLLARVVAGGGDHQTLLAALRLARGHTGGADGALLESAVRGVLRASGRGDVLQLAARCLAGDGVRRVAAAQQRRQRRRRRASAPEVEDVARVLVAAARSPDEDARREAQRGMKALAARRAAPAPGAAAALRSCAEASLWQLRQPAARLLFAAAKAAFEAAVEASRALGVDLAWVQAAAAAPGGCFRGRCAALEAAAGLGLVSEDADPWHAVVLRRRPARRRGARRRRSPSRSRGAAAASRRAAARPSSLIAWLPATRRRATAAERLGRSCCGASPAPSPPSDTRSATMWARGSSPAARRPSRTRPSTDARCSTTPRRWRFGAADDDVRVGALGVFEHRAVCGERFDALADRLAASFRDAAVRPAVVARPAPRSAPRRRQVAPAAAALADRAVGALGDRAAEHAAVAARNPRALLVGDGFGGADEIDALGAIATKRLAAFRAALPREDAEGADDDDEDAATALLVGSNGDADADADADAAFEPRCTANVDTAAPEFLAGAARAQAERLASGFAADGARRRIQRRPGCASGYAKGDGHRLGARRRRGRRRGSAAVVARWLDAALAAVAAPSDTRCVLRRSSGLGGVFVALLAAEKDCDRDASALAARAVAELLERSASPRAERSPAPLARRATGVRAGGAQLFRDAAARPYEATSRPSRRPRPRLAALRAPAASPRSRAAVAGRGGAVAVDPGLVANAWPDDSAAAAIKSPRRRGGARRGRGRRRRGPPGLPGAAPPARSRSWRAAGRLAAAAAAAAALAADDDGRAPAGRRLRAPVRAPAAATDANGDGDGRLTRAKTKVSRTCKTYRTEAEAVAAGKTMEAERKSGTRTSGTSGAMGKPGASGGKARTDADIKASVAGFEKPCARVKIVIGIVDSALGDVTACIYPKPGETAAAIQTRMDICLVLDYVRKRLKALHWDVEYHRMKTDSPLRRESMDPRHPRYIHGDTLRAADSSARRASRASSGPSSTSSSKLGDDATNPGPQPRAQVPGGRRAAAARAKKRKAAA
ncbi:hypothetical protein JL722_10904 [Aureococcus anophagefferens]|nr:hypothetical protein JL722_10904 [Aureococcus anophagefferens]